MSHEQLNQINSLKDRANMLQQARAFFKARKVLELDCPALSAYSNIDDFIDPISVTYCNNQKGYLHTSPELFMKKMLAKGFGDCFYLGHVFRDHEHGEMHSVEFTMVEWYRHKITYEQMIQETLDFVQLFVPVGHVKTFSYREALLRYTGIDYVSATFNDLKQYIIQHIPIQIDYNKESSSDLLILIFTEEVEPHFKEFDLVVLKDYPEEQSALAKLADVGGVKVAQRYEVFYKGVELANGYDELVGDHELYSRYEALNEKRAFLGKKKLPIDESFIAANAALPECRGVAVGFDRLMMLRHKNQAIHPTMAVIS